MHNDWDDAEYAIHTALMQLLVLQAKMPEDMAHTPTRNRMTMTAHSLEDAKDFLAAARARMPKE